MHKLLTTGAAVLLAASLSHAQQPSLPTPAVFDSVKLTTTLGGFGANETTVQVQRSGEVTLDGPGQTAAGRLTAAEAQELNTVITALRVGTLPADVADPFPNPGAPDPLAFILMASFEIEVAAPGELGGSTKGMQGSIQAQYQSRVQPVLSLFTRIQLRLTFGNAPNDHSGRVVVRNGTTLLDNLGSQLEVTPHAMAQQLAKLEGRFVRVRASLQGSELNVASLVSPQPQMRTGTVIHENGTLTLMPNAMPTFPGNPFPVQPQPSVAIEGNQKILRLLRTFVGKQVVINGFHPGFGRFIAGSVSAFTTDHVDFFDYVTTPGGTQYTVLATLPPRRQVRLTGISNSGRSYHAELTFNDTFGYLPVDKVELEMLAFPFFAPSSTPPSASTPGLSGAVGQQ